MAGRKAALKARPSSARRAGRAGCGWRRREPIVRSWGMINPPGPADQSLCAGLAPCFCLFFKGKLSYYEEQIEILRVGAL